MALTAAQTIKVSRPDLSTPPSEVGVAAATTIYKGAIVVANGSAFGTNAPTDGDLRFLGIARETADNATGAAGDINVQFAPVELWHYPVTGTTGAPEEISLPVYYTDDDTLSLTIVAGTGVAQSQVGAIEGFDFDGTPIVNLSKRPTS